MFWRLLRSAITPIAFAVRGFLEGKPEPRTERDAPEVDCPLHGRTFLHRTRQTACCGSFQWIHAGDVASRAAQGRIYSAAFCRMKLQSPFRNLF